MHGEAHHVVVAAVDLLDEGAGKALDAVAARLVRVRIGIGVRVRVGWGVSKALDAVAARLRCMRLQPEEHAVTA